MSEIAIDVHGLYKKFGEKTVVRDVSMYVREGEIFGFLGPNGSGKTTTIRMMCGLLHPDSGSGTCLGHDIITQQAAIKLQIGYMPQRFSMWEDLTIRENMEFIGRVYGIPDRKARIDSAIETLGLHDRANQLVRTLSGGWKQRMALASCLLHNPKLLLLDEPTAGMDPQARCDLWEELYELAGRGIAILVTTHYMDEAARCHRVAYIFDGQVIAQGTPSEIVEQQHLVTFAIYGEQLEPLNRSLEHLPGVGQTIIFGTVLHVSGEDKELLERSIRSVVGTSHRVELVPTSLEDVFIHLMRRTGSHAEPAS